MSPVGGLWLTRPMKQPEAPREGRVDVLAGEELIDGVGEILRLGLGARDADGVLIVDGAVVADCAMFVEQEHFGRARGAELIGDFVF